LGDQIKHPQVTNATINMKSKKQHTYRLPFVPLSLVFEGGLFHLPGVVDLLMVVVDMVEVDVDGFRMR
jgi:hypothetical protein